MKHKRIIFVFLLLLLISFMSLYIFAQGVGYIQIKCEPGAMVFLDNNFVGTTSSELGGLILQDVPADSHQIKIVKEGFEPQSVKIDLMVNEIYVYEVKEFIPQLDVTQEGEADTDTIKKRVGSLLIETLPIDCIIEIPKLNINKEHYGNKTKKTWVISNISIGSYKLNFIALGKKIEYELKIEEGTQKHLLVNILKNEVKEIVQCYVNFSVEAGNGTIEVRADGNLINSGDLVEEGAKVIFEVTPDVGQIVRSWEVDGTKKYTPIRALTIENLQSVKDFKVNFGIIPYKIGGKGPAGGWIFYDKGKYTNGWRYLEAAPESTEWNYIERSKCRQLIGGTETGIGTGKNNTDIICKTDRVARLCDTLVYGGYADWFLPSMEELRMMCENLYLKGVGGFDVDDTDDCLNYCSSSAGDPIDIAWAFCFIDCIEFTVYNDMGNKYRVRAVRVF
jgi:hypothetical protein